MENLNTCFGGLLGPEKERTWQGPPVQSKLPCSCQRSRWWVEDPHDQGVPMLVPALILFFGGHPAQLVSTLKSVRHTLRHMFFAVKMQSLHCNMRMFFSDTSHTIIPYFHGGQYELRFQWSTRRRHEPFCLQPCTAAASRCFRPAKSDCEYS